MHSDDGKIWPANLCFAWCDTRARGKRMASTRDELPHQLRADVYFYFRLSRSSSRMRKRGEEKEKMEAREPHFLVHDQDWSTLLARILGRSFQLVRGASATSAGFPLA